MGHAVFSVNIAIPSAICQSNPYLSALASCEVSIDQPVTALLPDKQSINVDLLAFLFGTRNSEIPWHSIAEYYSFAALFGCKIQLEELSKIIQRIYRPCLACQSEEDKTERLKSEKCYSCNLTADESKIDFQLIKDLTRIGNINFKALPEPVVDFVKRLDWRLLYPLVKEMIPKMYTDRLAEELLRKEKLLFIVQTHWRTHAGKTMCISYNCFQSKSSMNKTLKRKTVVKSSVATEFDSDVFLLECFPRNRKSLLTHPLCVESMTEFLQNLATIGKHLPLPAASLDNTLGMASAAGWKNMIVTGGAVTNALHKVAITESSISDVDLFLYGSNTDQIKQCKLQLEYFKQQAEPGKVYFGQRGNVIYVFFLDQPAPIQVILTSAKNKYEVVSSFDLSFCQALFDGTKVYAPIDCIEALNSRNCTVRYDLLADNEKQEKHQIQLKRIHKAFVKGFPCTNLTAEDKSKYDQYVSALSLVQPDASTSYKSSHCYFYPQSSHTPDEIDFFLTKLHQLERLVTDPNELQFNCFPGGETFKLRLDYDSDALKEERRILDRQAKRCKAAPASV